MNTILSTDKQYKEWFIEVKQKVQSAQIKAALKVNQELLNLYWELGREIVEKQSASNWGEALIPQLSKDLSAAFSEIKGFSPTNLAYIRRWYLFYKRGYENLPQLVANLYLFDNQIIESNLNKSDRATSQEQNHSFEILPQVVAKIPWGHNREIISKCQDVAEALFYVQQTIKNNWSRAILSAQMESKLYQRQGKAIDNFEVALPQLQADLARETLKNPYNFDFLTLGKEAHERDLEMALTGHIQKFLLELGQGFAYMGQQFHINVAGDDFYLDLLFYHTRLRCYVIVELKATEFRPEYAGKLNFYLNVVHAQIKHPDDQPSIGILLCKTPNKVMVEYGLENIKGPLGVAEYQIMNAIPENLKGNLPSIEELESELM